MSVTERISDLVSLLKSRTRGVRLEDLQTRWHCSPSTARRMLDRAAEVHRFLYVPEDVRRGTYRLHPDTNIEVPGLFFRPDELAALMGMEHWLESLGVGVLTERLEPIRHRLRALLLEHGIKPETWEQRVKLLPMHMRPVDPDVLLEAFRAILARKRISFSYQGARDAAPRARKVSPQNIVRYRDNWYLDAFDHAPGLLKSFALSRAQDVCVLNEKAREIEEPELDGHFAEAYGIFGGRARSKAVLVFEGEAARIVREERWHPKQTTHSLSGDRVRLEFPCGKIEELTRDVLRFADEVTVVGPPALREAVSAVVQRAAARLERKKKKSE